MIFSIIFFGFTLLLSLLQSASAAPLRYRRSKMLNRRTTYTLKDTYAGDTFFDDWDFFTDTDPTEGLVDYQSKEDATSKGLARVENGVAIIAVDSNSTLPSGTNRASVRISTKNTYNGGLFIYDVPFMPVGCGTWPAIWSTATQNWPNNGEIDMIEGVHESTQNQITMHTNAGCSLATGQAITGTVSGTTCESSGSNNNGCPTMDTTKNSWGSDFNTAGGGVFAKLWDDTGIKIWHFSRDNIPADITSKSPDPSTWGNPVSFLPSGDSCNVSDHFKDHTLIINITLCGQWAGATFSCGGTCQSAVMDPSNFVDAQWKINSIMVYQPS
ncbi:putative glycoside hydrolase family 16 protein [Lentinula raphanica]|uniref:Glycoside hydrolase family 16 protein n=1 Tax=Lentinula raphanica TaxID=153919 RepID=A0AA38UKS2_9AGAR|nr:putative glycoside hydrolase family 16 protein [Lentinula raphanica]KAJ3844441.1 putative glycoside hydrolase family 16 protein [Lentinula raphanica]